jgi:hypothetical protein
LGYLTTAFFLGQFFSPIVTLPVTAAGASLGTLFLLSAALSAVFGAVVLLGISSTSRPRTWPRCS